MDLTRIVNQPETSIVDVREPYEFDEGHVPGAVNIPLASLLDHLQDFQQKGAPIVVYCDGGNRGRQGMLLLQSQGVQDVYNGGTLLDVQACLARVAD